MEFGSVGFWGEGRTGVPGEKPLGARERTNNKLNPHMVSTAGFEPWQCGRRALSPLRHPCSLEQSNSVPTFLGQMQTGCRWLGTKYTYQRNETVFPTDFVFEKFPEENQSKIVYFYSVIYEFSPHRQDVHWTLSWHKWTDSEYCSRCLATVMRTPLGSSVNPPIHSSRPRESLLCDKKSQNSTRHQKTSIKPLRTRHKQHAIERRSRYVTLRW